MRRTVLFKTARKLADAGIGVGSQADGGIVTRTYADHCNVTTLDDNAYAGTGAGQSNQSTVSHTTAVKCNLKTFGEESDAGVGVGYQKEGNVTRTIANHCSVVTIKKYAYAGIGGRIIAATRWYYQLHESGELRGVHQWI